jgi:DNA repair exonuclease SbcCD ATPase subunit
MDLEQIIKRLDWLDDERRKDKTTIATLEEKINTMAGSIPPLLQQIKEQSLELARLSVNMPRFDQLEGMIGQVRVETNRAVESSERQRVERDRDIEKQRRADVEALSIAIGDVRKGLEPIAELKRSLQARVEEDFRLGRLIEELEQKLVESTRGDEEYRRAQKLLEDAQRQDTKRLTDLQGEVAASRKRLEEQRGKADVNADSLRKIEMRLAEYQAAEGERRQAQTAFIEKQNLLQVERDRVWKDWKVRFEVIEKSAQNLDAQLQTLDATHRAVKRAQDGFDDISQRFERRINEITEMQRLTEDRFRQEWVSFKADDQKRWTNYTLSQEETQREVGRQFEKLNERLVLLEDLTQEMNDLQHQFSDETQKRLQSLLSTARDWVEQYEKTFGQNR